MPDLTRRPHIPIVPDAERRTFLKLMAASMALAGAGCSGPPQETILPYVDMPENMVPGKPLYYATAFMHRGYAQGVLVENNMGRPTKIEGNPRHPASLGATSVFAQASVLQLWDPDRSQAVRQGGALSTWDAFRAALSRQRLAWEANGGAGLRILTGTVTSPTLAAQMAALLERYPNARWHSHDPVHDDAGAEAANLAFGRATDMLYRFDRAAAVLAVDADVFGDWPGHLRYARDFMQGRRAGAPQFDKRLYALEASPGLLGAVADNRLALPPHDIERTLWRIAARLGMPGLPPEIPPAPDERAGKWETVLAALLAAQRGRCLIVAGGAVSPRSRALAHLMNAHLGNLGKTVIPIAPVQAGPLDHAQSIAALADDMRAGAVTALVILGANPVYDAPADLGFEQALRKVPFSAHLGLYRDETAHASTWHLPAAHGYEAWSDGRAFDGSAAIAQPVIAPLYGGRSAHELLSMLAEGNERAGHALVRNYWRGRIGAGDFDHLWQDALRQGVVGGSASAPLALRPARSVPPPDFEGPALRALFVSDTSVGAGEYANNAWLQELPRPFSTLTWDNAAIVGERTAQALGVQSGDMLRLSLADHPLVALEAPAWVWRGQAEGVVTLPLGYGRRSAGHVGNGVGFDAYRLRTLHGPHALKAQRSGRHVAFATTQNHQQMEGRDIARMATLAEFRRNPHFATDEKRERTPQESLYPPWEYKDYKWGMAIDLNACIGCRSCTIACQAENNIPVVGREQVMRGREMHWIRVDRYDTGTSAHPRSVFQPVPCMHCENAPCELVCPVEAAVHDSEGLNLQVYNRCVGTRFCSNNCPYKVRRFNFLHYTGTTLDRAPPAYNPEVTVRRSGVMEKCTYCVQRITRARIEAEKLGRRLQDGEVVTACQAVCPTEAIVFGDLNDPESRVNRAKASALDYSLLAELNTRPRTTYAALVLNPDDELT
ncbi:4Fe-4S dicluster domain-containing protein [Noviherbaspirillum sp. UKPF54]|uniref:4Fe-4S dicluster domain-containing protein n=1 Tax=Noviherbaspirillum sp. UKPF54 TaxID=2601898 RepID=UPI0011B158C4|nr:4Fe-4S dicluster domain-containing protein [Noviherbaspirillum sp. UKPF54]QDZ27915.1 4Fe-4S dicluster domain-containing protein [Noviherbaspirillum sp. UKPF54]